MRETAITALQGVLAGDRDLAYAAGPAASRGLEEPGAGRASLSPTDG